MMGMEKNNFGHVDLKFKIFILHKKKVAEM